MRSRQYPFLPSTLRVALLLAAIGSTSISHHVFAQTNEVWQQIDIPAQPLSSALQLLGEQTNLQIIYNSELVAGKTSPAIKGALSPDQALTQLLDNKSISFSIQGGTVRLQPVNKLNTVQVSATEIDAHSYTTSAVSIGKTAQALKDIPQSISIISQQQIQDQNLTDVSSALRQATGITLEAWNSGLEAQKISSRGFEITSIRYDGGSPTVYGNSYNTLPNLLGFEQVEVLRGSDALFTGAGNPGGSVNLVRKKPTAETQIKLNGSLGSWNNYRAEADVGGSLNESKTIRGRVAVAALDREYFYDDAEQDSQAFYGVTEFDLSSVTLLTLGVNYEDKTTKPWAGGGIPVYEDDYTPLDFPRSTSFVYDWNNLENTVADIFLKLSHDFNGNWKLNLNASDRKEDYDEYLGHMDPFVTPGTSTALWAHTTRDVQVKYDQQVIDINLTGNISLFGREHTLLVGADWKGQDFKYSQKMGAGIQDVEDIYNFNPDDYWSPDEVPEGWVRPYYLDNYQKNVGAYFSARFAITDRLSTVAGGRLSKNQYTGNRADGSDYAANLKSEFTPYVGFTYSVTKSTSLYGSVADVFESQAYFFTPDMSPLEPMIGRNHELGIKTELGESKVNAYLALYRTERDGQAVLIPGGTYPCCYEAEGLVVSEGVDLEISGEILPQWNLTAGYTYNKNEDRETGSRFSPISPKHLFKLWSSYQLQGSLSDWKLGGGWTSQSDFVSQDIDREGYDLLSLFAEYQINDNISAALNINNALDKEYFSSSTFYGEPRNATLTLRATF